MIGAVAVLTPVVTGLIGVGGRIGGVPRQLCQQCWSQCQSDNN